ncbi:hypothetical protein HRH25_17450 [Flavisolibacter sp. BT320]|nr:hypothetical protein [Flavisolibacter longurius]
MYTQTWKKYLPVIRILLKKAIIEDQKLQLNMSDFQKAAILRKSGHTFTIGIREGKSETIGLLGIAKDLSAVLLSYTAAKELFMQNDYTIRFDAKCQLSFKKVASPSP